MKTVGEGLATLSHKNEVIINLHANHGKMKLILNTSAAPPENKSYQLPVTSYQLPDTRINSTIGMVQCPMLNDARMMKNVKELTRESSDRMGPD